MHKRKSLDQYYKDLRRNKYIARFGKLLHDKNLWKFNQYAVIWGVTLGVMCAWIPIPFHTTIAVAIALIVDCNIPLVVLSIWFANPVTMPFMYYIAFRVGEAILHINPSDMAFHPSIKDLMAVFEQIWPPLLLGCFVCSIFCGLISYTILSILWRYSSLQSRFYKR